MSWAVNPVEPDRKTGPGWSGSPSTTTPQRGGWFALLEKVGPSSGVGTFAPRINPLYIINADFEASGEITAALVLAMPRTAILSGLGRLLTKQYELKTLVETIFTGRGQLEGSNLNDGLAAVFQIGYKIDFSGQGYFDSSLYGGVSYPDGLSAFAVERYLYPTYFSGPGQLVAVVKQIQKVLANLIGSGVLTPTNIKQLYPILLSLSSTGQLGADVDIVRDAYVLSNFLAGGTLSVQDFALYMRSLGVAGAGALAAMLFAAYASSAVEGGVGTVSALVSQVYSLAPTTSGAGQLSAAYFVSYLFAPNLIGTGILSATALGAVSFQPQKVIKLTDTAFAWTTTYKQVTGFTAAADYPGSQVTSDTLVSQYASSSAFVGVRLVVPGSISSIKTVSFRIVRVSDSAVIATGSIAGGSNGPTYYADSVGALAALSAGDAFRMEVITSSGTASDQILADTAMMIDYNAMVACQMDLGTFSTTSTAIVPVTGFVPDGSSRVEGTQWLVPSGFKATATVNVSISWAAGGLGSTIDMYLVKDVSFTSTLTTVGVLQKKGAVGTNVAGSTTLTGTVQASSLRRIGVFIKRSSGAPTSFIAVTVTIT